MTVTPTPAGRVRPGDRIRDGQRYHRVHRCTDTAVPAANGGSVPACRFELADGTLLDVPTGQLVDVVGTAMAGAR